MMSYTRWFLSIVACCLSGMGAAWSAPVHTDYAVLFSGGYDRTINHARYYNQTLRMWNLLTGTLGFNPTNIYLLFADGTDMGEDQCIHYDVHDACDGWKDSDWSSVAVANTSILSATRQNFQNTLGFLSSIVTSDDSLYFWSFDHGGTENNPADPNDVTLTAWNQESIRDDELAAWVDPIDAKAEIFAFGQCHSGGIVDDLQLALNPDRFAAWAADGCEVSWGEGWAKAWADGIESGLRWSQDLGTYAVNNDPFGPFGNQCLVNGHCETPGWAGANIHIVTNEIPEPASLLLACAGLALVRLTTRRPPRSVAGAVRKS